MGSSRVPDDIKIQIDGALENLNSPEKLRGSELLSLCMVTRHVKKHPSVLPYQALKAVLTDTLDLLEKENPDHADLLRGRFWEELSPTQMMSKERPKKWAEKTFFNYQKEARGEFHSLLWQKEENCREEAKTSRFVRLALILAAVTVVALSISMFVFNRGAQPLGPAATPSTISPTAASLNLAPASPSTPASVLKTSVCGEAEQIPVPPNEARFLRSQGVSSFTMENTPGILNNTVRSLAIDQTGLWIGYLGTDENRANGLGHYDKTSFVSCGLSDVVGAQNINALAVSQTGKVWVGTEKNGIASFDGREWRRYTTDNGLPSNEIYTLMIDDEDNVWAGTREGVAKFDGSRWSVPYQANKDTIFNNRVTAIAFDGQKNIWIGHLSDGVSEYGQGNNAWVYYTAPNELAGNEIRRIIVRPASGQQPESVWFATADGGVSRFERGKWTTYRVEDGLPSNDVRDLALDRYSRIWAATAKGVSYFDGRLWKRYNTFDTVTIAIGSACSADKRCFDDDHVWTGTRGTGLTHSRLPLPDPAIQITKICFVVLVGSQRKPTCPSFDSSFDTSLSEWVVTATFPEPLKPDETFRFEITVSPEKTYQLRPDRGDYLSNTDEDDFNLFKAYYKIAVEGNTIEPGEPYTFTDYDSPFVAPQLTDGGQEQQFVSTWRVWMFTRYVGPYIHLVFKVRK